MDFFGGAGGYSFDLGASSGASGGSNEAGGFSVGAFNTGGSNNNIALIVAGVAVATVLVLVLRK